MSVTEGPSARPPKSIPTPSPAARKKGVGGGEDFADGYVPFRSKRDAVRRRRTILAGVVAVLGAGMVVAACWADARSRAARPDPVPPPAVPKVSSDAEGVDWRYEEMVDYLRAKGLKFNEGGVRRLDTSSPALSATLQFENTGRNHWSFIRMIVMPNPAEAESARAESRKQAVVWGRFLFTYDDSPRTKELETQRHLDSIRVALE